MYLRPLFQPQTSFSAAVVFISASSVTWNTAWPLAHFNDSMTHLDSPPKSLCVLFIYIFCTKCTFKYTIWWKLLSETETTSLARQTDVTTAVLGSVPMAALTAVLLWVFCAVILVSASHEREKFLLPWLISEQ